MCSLQSELESQGSWSFLACTVADFIVGTVESLESCEQENDMIFKGYSLSKAKMHQSSDSILRYLSPQHKK